MENINSYIKFYENFGSIVGARKNKRDNMYLLYILKELYLAKVYL